MFLNDKGHIRGKLRLAPPATLEEMEQVRRMDRAAQGITPKQEEAGRAAAHQVQRVAGDRLTVAELPHEHTAAVTDPLEPMFGGPGYENLLVLCPNSIHFFGSQQHVDRLKWNFGGWTGGAAPIHGFWGTDSQPLPTRDDVSRLLFPAQIAAENGPKSKRS